MDDTVENNFFAYDLHIHSSYSRDCLMKIPTILKVARKKGINGIAITDHNTIRGSIEAQKIAKGKGLNIVNGAEFETEKGHIIGLFITEEINEHDAIAILDMIREQGGIAILAHPFQKMSTIDKELIKKVHGIEVWNSRTSPAKNVKSYLMAHNFKLAKVAGSDAHMYFEIGRAITVTKNEDIKRSILKCETSVVGKSSLIFPKILSFLIEVNKSRNVQLLSKALRNAVNIKLL
jgi:predicted metal-dependent phosphoesterase TrpH